eukprot:1260378-Lingulodinium_polyedra.AAC.1
MQLTRQGLGGTETPQLGAGRAAEPGFGRSPLLGAPAGSADYDMRAAAPWLQGPAEPELRPSGPGRAWIPGGSPLAPPEEEGIGAGEAAGET